MLNSISWSEYLTFISVSALLWYAFVLYRYFRHDLIQIAQQTNRSSEEHLNLTGSASHFHQSDVGSGIYQPEERESIHIVQSMTDEVQAYLEEAGKNKAEKEEILLSLARIVRKYSPLAGSEYKGSLDDLLKNEAEINCGVSLSENEISRIWSGS